MEASPRRRCCRLKANGKSEREIGMMLQHAHWDWLQKAPYAGLLAMPCLGIRVKEEWQGLAMIELGVKRAELQPDQGKEIVCIEFLEVAPWNLKSMVDKPKYKLVGSRLVEAAVQISISESWHGRVGLFALPQAEQFYQGCGMVKVEGAGRKGMQWYEMSRGAAQAFISGGA